jgi:tartrate dehydratase alpha subunit/fumarate hydratase class I-like protein
MHPLAGDLSALKNNELETKITDLTRKYFLTYNTDVKQQIAQLLDTYRAEQQQRQKAEYDKLMNSQDKSLDKLININ